MKRPCNPKDAIRMFLVQSRTVGRKNVTSSFPVTQPFCEVEARIGILKSTYGLHDCCVLSSGPKRMPSTNNTKNNKTNNRDNSKLSVAHARTNHREQSK